MTLKLNPEARAIYKAIREDIKRRLVLHRSSAILDSFEPVGDKDEILQRQAYLRENLPRIRPKLRDYLSKIRSIKFRRDFLHDRILIVDESELEKAGNLNLCEVSTSLDDAEGYPLVLSTIGYGIDVELTPSDIAPELYIMPLWGNKETLQALVSIGELTGEKSVAKEILEALKELEEVMEKGGSLMGSKN